MKKPLAFLAALAFVLAACGASNITDAEQLKTKTFTADASAWIAAGVLADADWKPLSGRANQAVGSNDSFPAILFGIYDADAKTGDFSVPSSSQGATTYFSNLSDGTTSSLELCARGDLASYGDAADLSAYISYTDTNGVVNEIPTPVATYSGYMFGHPFFARSGFGVSGEEVLHYVDYCAALNGRVLTIQTVQNATNYADPALTQAIKDYFASFATVAAIDEQIRSLEAENLTTGVLDWREAAPAVRAEWETLRAKQAAIEETYLSLAMKISETLPFEKELNHFFATPDLTLAGLGPLLVEPITK